MADGGDEPVALKIVNRLAEIDPAAWDACAGPENPFVCHAFLSALEDSGSAVENEGWGPSHLVLEDADGRMIGAVAAYLKSHSQGEYVFDHGWAHALENAGGKYYPKIVAGVPFSPVPGPRLLIHPEADQTQVTATLAAGLVKLCEVHEASSVHVNFLPKAQWEALGEHGFLQRQGQQFHWENNGYQTFDDFLAALSSRKRKNIRKERQAVVDAGVTIRRLSGDDLKPEHWDAFYQFYRSTTDRKWGWDYLKRDFFDLLQERMREKVVLVFCEYNGHAVAGALNLQGTDTLYGRNWGALARFKNLHFEACYYQAIDHAIEHGLQRVEAGAQGQHKIQRGYLPKATYSAHYISHPGFRRAVADFLRREREAVDEDIEILMDYSPFKKGG
jgi:predicted N-acyltransferase